MEVANIDITETLVREREREREIEREIERKRERERRARDGLYTLYKICSMLEHERLL